MAFICGLQTYIYFSTGAEPPVPFLLKEHYFHLLEKVIY